MQLSIGRRGGRPLTKCELQQWETSRRGRRLLSMEECQIRRVLPELFGRHIIQIGVWGSEQRLLASTEIRHRAVLGQFADHGVQALIDLEAIPIQSKSVDAVILPHTLEFMRSPHMLLREVERILNDRGRLIVLGFNPWSILSLRERLGLRYQQLPPGGRFYSVGRVCDWLTLLGLESTDVIRFGIGFPWSPARSIGDPFSVATIAAPLTTNYLLAARKRVIPINRIDVPKRAQVRPLLGSATAPLAGARSSQVSTCRS